MGNYHTLEVELRLVSLSEFREKAPVMSIVGVVRRAIEFFILLPIATRVEQGSCIAHRASCSWVAGGQ